MKRKLATLVTLGAIIACCGCGSGVAQEEYDSLKESYVTLESENEAFRSEKEQLQNDLASKSSELDAVNAELDTVNAEFNAYKEKMAPYEKLSVAEAEAKTSEAERKKAEAEKAKKEQEESEAAAKAAAESEAAAAAAAEEAKGYETGITYDQLARTPDDYVGKKVKFTGTVVQVLESDTETQIRLAVNDDYDTILYCGYDPTIVSSRVLEDDTITIYGTSLGLYSYTSTLGSTITIPSVYVDRIDQ